MKNYVLLLEGRDSTMSSFLLKLVFVFILYIKLIFGALNSILIAEFLMTISNRSRTFA